MKCLLKSLNRLMRVARIGIGCIGLFAVSALSSCSVAIEDGKISCADGGNCPNRFYCWVSDQRCHKNPEKGSPLSSSDAEVPPAGFDAATGDSVADQSDAGGFGGSGGSSSPCDGSVITQCAENQCGTIGNGCGTFTCPECKAGSTCRSNQCVANCAGCFIDDHCYQPGELNPNSQCQVCSPAASDTGWSPNDRSFCDDKNECTLSDKCTGSACGGAPRTCDDHCDCTLDQCNPVTGCANTSTCPATELCDCSTSQCVTDCGVNRCRINNVCYDNGSKNPTNECELCDASKAQTDWTITVASACGEGTENECAAPNTCDSAGKCRANQRADGTLCGDKAESDCHSPDTCQGGQCIKNNIGKNIPCGETAKPCFTQSYCDGAGECKGGGKFQSLAICKEEGICNYEAYCNPITQNCAVVFKIGTKCADTGNVCAPRQCDLQGECGVNPVPLPNGTNCGETGNVCTDRQCRMGSCQTVNLTGQTCGSDINECTARKCDSKGSCSPTNYGKGTACSGNTGNPCTANECNGKGSCGVVSRSTDATCGTPGDGVCKGQDHCDGYGHCETNYLADGTECGDKAHDCYNHQICLSGKCADNPKSNGASCELSSDGPCFKNATCLKTGDNVECKRNYYVSGDRYVCARKNRCNDLICNGNPDCPSEEPFIPGHKGDSCGDSTTTQCTNPDTCNEGQCDPNNTVGNDCRPEGSNGCGKCNAGECEPKECATASAGG
jgi:hypothetical protein